MKEYKCKKCGGNYHNVDKTGKELDSKDIRFLKDLCKKCDLLDRINKKTGKNYYIKRKE